jgi:hypothetical protein
MAGRECGFEKKVSGFRREGRSTGRLEWRNLCKKIPLVRNTFLFFLFSESHHVVRKIFI